MTSVDALLHRGIHLQGSGDLDGAAAAFERVLSEQATHPAALYSLTAISLNRGRQAEAIEYAERCVRGNLGSVLGWYIYSAALSADSRSLEALGCVSRALELDPGHVDSIVLRGSILLTLDQRGQAISEFERALRLDPAHPAAQKSRLAVLGVPGVSNADSERLAAQGIALQNGGDLKGARALFQRALTLQADNFAALYSLAVVSLNLGAVADGLASADQCVTSHPSSALSWYIRGCALKTARRFTDALSDFDRALAITPNYKEALSEKGLVCAELNDYIQALIQFNEVLRIEPNHKLALSNAAMVLTILKKNEEAAQFYSRLLAVDPEYEYALGSLQYARLHCCDWTDFEKNRELIIQGVREGKRSCRPLAFLALSDSSADQLNCTSLFMEQSYPKQSQPLWKGEQYKHSKIRLGYLSPDLREHPVGHLMAGVFEHHDKSKFEVYAFSLGLDDNSSLRKRFIAASDKFFDVRGEASLKIAELIREHEIDVLIDLAGPTADSRPEVFGYRSAPVQVGYLGYAGTTGTSYMDYLIADKTVIPAGDEPNYSEKVLHLSGCYLPVDAQVVIAERTPTRAEMGLPETGFVFCSFNHDYKINPPIFNTWMRILKQVEGSVLWLMKLNQVAETNLRLEAEKHGVSGSRLVFAGRVPSISDHLARYRLAGLFLDTTPYNAHSTATDVLRVGLPVLTLVGHSFQSRVATSILRAIGLPELAVTTLEEYEQLAVQLANSPEQADALRQKLADRLQDTTVFDPKVKTEDLERLYTAAHERC